MSTSKILTAVAILFFQPFSVLGSSSSKITQEVLERVFWESTKRSGRELLEIEAKKSAIETLRRLSGKYGDDVLKVARDGGLELIEAAPKFGDEIFEVAIKVSPDARRAFARNLPELFPLAKRVGVDALELEARTPGLALKTFSIFGDDCGKIVAKSARSEDVPRLLSYGEKADTKATRKLLIEHYEKEGKSIFERIPPKLVFSLGLRASMLSGNHRGTEPFQAIGKAIVEDDNLEQRAGNQFTIVGGTIVFIFAALLFRRFGLMSWTRLKVSELAAVKNSEKGSAGNTNKPCA